MNERPENLATADRNLPPRIVTAVAKPGHIAVLEEADKGDQRAFVDRVAVLALDQILHCARIAEQALSGVLNRPAGNGGRRVGDDHLPPCNGEPTLQELGG